MRLANRGGVERGSGAAGPADLDPVHPVGPAESDKHPGSFPERKLPPPFTRRTKVRPPA